METGILASEDLVNTKDIHTYFEETAPMGSAHHHRSCLTGETGQNPKMTRTIRIKGVGVIYKGCDVDYKGVGVIYKGCKVDFKGVGVIQKGCDVDYNGVGVIYKGCDVDDMGVGVKCKGCDVYYKGVGELQGM